jgi:hypothetical protein
MSEPRPQGHVETARAFALALVAGDFAEAHAMLSPAAAVAMTAADLAQNLAQMLAYSGEDASGAEVSVEATMTDWPDRYPDDMGWAYVSISKLSDIGGFSEAVTLVIDRASKVRDIVWGRP